MHNGATFAIVLAFAAAKAGDSFAQERHGPSTLTTHSLKGGAYWVEGGRANTGFIVDDKGVIVFDAQMTQEDVQKELAEIARITPKRVDQIVIKPPERMRTIGSGRNNRERQSSRRHYQTWQFEAPDAALISPLLSATARLSIPRRYRRRDIAIFRVRCFPDTFRDTVKHRDLPAHRIGTDPRPRDNKKESNEEVN